MPIKRDLSSYYKHISDAVPQAKSTKSYIVENQFEPTFKDGKCSVVMRFLPSHTQEFKPFVENRIHIFKTNGGWFVCDCLEKFGQECPVCKYNSDVWKHYGSEKVKEGEKEIYLATKHLVGSAKNEYYSNVLIVKNNNAPDTEGKVFRYKFGVLIMKKIDAAWKGYDDEEEGHIDGFNPFDWYQGANFTLTAEKGSYGPDYSSSRFGKQRPLCRFDRGTGEFVEMTNVEMDKVESNLYTLDDVEKKQEASETAERIKQRYLEKTGKPLEFESPEELSVEDFGDDYSGSKARTAVETDINVDIVTKTTTKKKDEPVDNEVDFFASLEKM